MDVGAPEVGLIATAVTTLARPGRPPAAIPSEYAVL